MAWPIIGEIATAVLPSLLGGLFGSKKKTTENRVDYNYLVNASRAAGFNPLTALRNGGSANATTTTTGPGLSSSKFIANATAGVLDAFGVGDPHGAEREALELERAREEIKRLKVGTEEIGQRIAWYDHGGGLSSNRGAGAETAASAEAGIFYDSSVPRVNQHGLPEGYWSDGVTVFGPDGAPVGKVYSKYERVFNNQTGATFKWPNPDLTETGFAEMASGLAMLGGGEQHANGNPDKDFNFGGTMMGSWGTAATEAVPWLFGSGEYMAPTPPKFHPLKRRMGGGVGNVK